MLQKLLGILGTKERVKLEPSLGWCEAGPSSLVLAPQLREAVDRCCQGLPLTAHASLSIAQNRGSTFSGTELQDFSFSVDPTHGIIGPDDPSIPSLFSLSPGK